MYKIVGEAKSLCSLYVSWFQSVAEREGGSGDWQPDRSRKADDGTTTTCYADFTIIKILIDLKN